MATKAKSAVVLLVNPAPALHNILPTPNEKKEILVIVTGEGNDHEVLALARRFLSVPEVGVDVWMYVCMMERWRDTHTFTHTHSDG